MGINHLLIKQCYLIKNAQRMEISLITPDLDRAMARLCLVERGICMYPVTHLQRGREGEGGGEEGRRLRRN